jgi:hypothetical protein
MDLNTDGLGSSPIGNFLRKDQWNSSDVDIKRGIAGLISERSSKKGISRDDAESLGARCEPAPSTECTYSGEMWFRIGPLPHDSPQYGKRTIVKMQVRFSCLKPQELVLQKQEYDVADE